MGAFIARRIAAGIVLLLVASFLIYLLVSLSGNPLAALEANPHIAKATIAAAREQLHLNEPLLERYWTWLTGFLQGNFGTATTGQAVGPQVVPRLLVTLQMVIPAVLISIVLGIVVGVIGAVRQYSIIDHLSTGLAYVFFSTPVFVLAILLKDFLAVDFNKGVGHTVLYTVGQNTPGVTGFGNVTVDVIEHTILPVVTLVLITYATWSRYQRSSMLDVLNADYIRLARAKGLSPRRVLYVHALRNALIPVTTVIALDFAAIIGGALVTEIVFGWEGFGQFFFTGLTGPVSPDVNVVQAWFVISAAAVVLFNLIADILYGVLDPRIRYA
ncbi:MAG TPA: ABC transporter permease [Streptosporangiaceae bacterium]|jgi:peptide/nickel transport system permease protein